MAHDVFLSYSRKDSAMKDRVQKSLADAGLSVWTDANLTPGTPEWFQAIERAIDATRVLVVLLSPDAKQSEWVQKEIGYAKAWKKPIFPILVRGDEAESTPFQIFGTQYVDVRDNTRYFGEMGRLIDAIQQNRGIQPTSPPPTPKPPPQRKPQVETPKPQVSNTTPPLYDPSEAYSSYIPFESDPQTPQKPSTPAKQPEITSKPVAAEQKPHELSRWNLSDQVRLLYWYFFQPEQIANYKMYHNYRELCNQPIISISLILPLLIATFPVITGQLSLIPPETGIVYSVSPLVWLIIGVLLLIVQIPIRDRDNNIPDWLRSFFFFVVLPSSGMISSQVLVMSYLPTSQAGIGLSILLLAIFSIVTLASLNYFSDHYEEDEFSFGLILFIVFPVVGTAAGQSVYLAINTFTTSKDVAIWISVIASLITIIIVGVLHFVLMFSDTLLERLTSRRRLLLVLTLIGYAILIWIYLLGGWRVLGIGGAIPA